MSGYPFKTTLTGGGWGRDGVQKELVGCAPKDIQWFFRASLFGDPKSVRIIGDSDYLECTMHSEDTFPGSTEPCGGSVNGPMLPYYMFVNGQGYESRPRMLVLKRR